LTPHNPQESNLRNRLLLAHEIRQAGGELTQTSKLKRSAGIREYADAFNALYE
jgi:hypothetical protein